MAAEWAVDDAMLDAWHERSRHLPERQIVPPGTVDLVDLKTKREEAADEAGEARYYENQVLLSQQMAESFSVPEMPLAVLQALLDVLEAGGIERLSAMDNIIKVVEGLRKIRQT